MVHDGVARHSLKGTGTILELKEGEPSVVWKVELWVAKPRGLGYGEFRRTLDKLGPRSVWRRILATGPAPEFVVLPRESTKTTTPSTTVIIRLHRIS